MRSRRHDRLVRSRRDRRFVRSRRHDRLVPISIAIIAAVAVPIATVAVFGAAFVAILAAGFDMNGCDLGRGIIRVEDSQALRMLVAVPVQAKGDLAALYGASDSG